jgi:hypothetical protein
MKLQTEVTTGKSGQKSDERLYFACPHVIAGESVEIYKLNPHRDKGETDQVLCEPCSWGPNPCDPPESLEEGGLCGVGPRGEPKLEGFSEAEAIARGWIPASRAMRYLLYCSNDSTGGEAADSRSGVLARRLHHSGLDEASQDFLWEAFVKGSYIRPIAGTPEVNMGFFPLTDKESLIAEMLVDQMFRRRT